MPVSGCLSSCSHATLFGRDEFKLRPRQLRVGGTSRWADVSSVVSSLSAVCEQFVSLRAQLVLDACYLFLLAATDKTALVAWFWAVTQLISIWQGADMCGV